MAGPILPLAVAQVVARNIVPLAREDIPVLNIVLDEHTGKAGIVSRLGRWWA